jgi:hypothetical protein
MCYYIKYAQKGLPCQVHLKNKWHSHIVTKLMSGKLGKQIRSLFIVLDFLYLLFRLHPTCYYYHYYKVGIGCISF